MQPTFSTTFYWKVSDVKHFEIHLLKKPHVIDKTKQTLRINENPLKAFSLSLSRSHRSGHPVSGIFAALHIEAT